MLTPVRKVEVKFLATYSFFSSLSSRGGLRFLRMDSPHISMRWALCTKRSRMPSARVSARPDHSLQRFATHLWLFTYVAVVDFVDAEILR